MKPVLILQHLSADGPAYLGRWLRSQGVAADVRNTEAGDAYPRSLADHAALAILGGEMSANDELPSLRQAEALFREALAHGVPTLGHCLGGQLMARALGGTVAASPAPEVGWQPLSWQPSPALQAWCGAQPPARVFQWHYEAFTLPQGATRLAGSAACAQQACVLGDGDPHGLHLAMQFHVEVDNEKLERWSRDDGARYGQALADHPDTVQSGAAMRASAHADLAAQQRLADRIYTRWLGLAGRR